jgi:multiple sugar transport system permease protein
LNIRVAPFSEGGAILIDWKSFMSDQNWQKNKSDLDIEAELEAGRRSALAKRHRFMWGLIFPAFLTLLFFEILPVASAFWTSIHRARLFDVNKTFVGLDNYIHLLKDPHFYRMVIPNTFLFTFIGLTIETVLGIGIAMMLNRKFRGESIIRVLLLFPLMVAPSISGILFSWLFNTQFGIVDVFLEAIGYYRVPWLAGRWTALFVIVISDVWLWTPWFAILVLAALQVQPPEPVEAARIDGANAFQVFTNITLPYLSPVLTICMLIRTFDLFRQFDQTWVITTGGPARSTEFFSIYAYKEFFEYTRYDIGNAASLLGASVMIVFGVIMYRTFARITMAEREKV